MNSHGAEWFEKQKENPKSADSIPSDCISDAKCEDEMHRKWILEYLYDGLRKADEQFKDHFKSAIDWLKKQKELPFVKDVMLGYPGLYFYDGERMHFRSNQAMEWKMTNKKQVIAEATTLKEMKLFFWRSHNSNGKYTNYYGKSKRRRYNNNPSWESSSERIV